MGRCAIACHVAAAYGPLIIAIELDCHRVTAVAALVHGAGRRERSIAPASLVATLGNGVAATLLVHFARSVVKVVLVSFELHRLLCE